MTKKKLNILKEEHRHMSPAEVGQQRLAAIDMLVKPTCLAHFVVTLQEHPDGSVKELGSVGISDEHVPRLCDTLQSLLKKLQEMQS